MDGTTQCKHEWMEYKAFCKHCGKSKYKIILEWIRKDISYGR